jgi:hypothetical protein
MYFKGLKDTLKVEGTLYLYVTVAATQRGFKGLIPIGRTKAMIAVIKEKTPKYHYSGFSVYSRL